jgi:chromate transporter
MISTLLALALMFGQLSLLAFGGGNPILPEMHRQVVDVHHWTTDGEFGALFALAQASPGPNMMIVPLIGWHVAGLAGALVSCLAMFVPSSIVTLLVLHQWQRFRNRPWRASVQNGLVPITTGLIAASAVVIAVGCDTRLVLGGITLACALLATRTHVHPLWLLAAGAALGWSGLGQ